ncbi:folate-binding protein [Devosia sp. ZB163]|uniref:CAF17-like 4Fe-4S cluster assembly/insertion protein YgfZ n=1 Tax=Devosia sp. ZB163 TaxID=3025938 RepID=UPI0023625390|nr:folate-binding protein [Devosia sp. ZB163]MDC9822642.1 folate-binding protein [Devosia sp. ZB163]
MPTILRPSRAAFRFSGPEAQKLLFDVVTGRLLAEPGPAVWWALLSPQGKVQAEGLSGWAADAFWLDVDTSVADAFLNKMKLYRLRAKVEIDDLRDTHSVGWNFDGWSGGIAHADPRGLGERVIAGKSATAEWLPADETFARHRIAAGIPEQGPDFGIDEVFAHDIGLDLLDGIDFVKGCYIGQEVVSRMKHRGTARRRPVIVSGIEAPAGTAVVAGNREAGTIGEVVDGKAVAILRLDRITDPAAVTVAGRPVNVTLPPYATYQFGEATADEG